MSSCRLVACIISFAGASLGLLACSGAETQDVLSQAPGAASSSGTSGTSAGSSGTNSGGGSGTPDGGSSSGVFDNCVQEQEPNDSKGTANVLAPARCGTVSQNDQKDFLTFQLKPSTKTMSLNFTGRVRLRVDVAGRNTVELTPDQAGVIPFVKGEPYFIQVTPLTDTTSDVPWRVAVIER